jgi:hypothetical protein
MPVIIRSHESSGDSMGQVAEHWIRCGALSCQTVDLARNYFSGAVALSGILGAASRIEAAVRPIAQTLRADIEPKRRQPGALSLKLP